MKEEKTTPLRQRMMEDMRLRGMIETIGIGKTRSMSGASSSSSEFGPDPLITILASGSCEDSI